MRKRIRAIAALERPDMRSGLEELFSESPVKLCETVTTGVDLINAFRRHKPQVIVTGAVLPDTDGLAALRFIRSMPGGRDAFVIIVTGFISEPMRAEAIELGAAHIMLEPISFDALMARITERRRTTASVLAEKRREADNRLELDTMISQRLMDGGISPGSGGFRYLRDAVITAVYDLEAISAVMKVLYPSVADKHGTSAACVERTIRHAIALAWDKDPDRVNRILGRSDNRTRPKSREFIASLAELIRLERSGYIW